MRTHRAYNANLASIGGQLPTAGGLAAKTKKGPQCRPGVRNSAKQGGRPPWRSWPWAAALPRSHGASSCKARGRAARTAAFVCDTVGNSYKRKAKAIPENIYGRAGAQILHAAGQQRKCCAGRGPAQRACLSRAMRLPRKWPGPLRRHKPDTVVMRPASEATTRALGKTRAGRESHTPRPDGARAPCATRAARPCPCTGICARLGAALRSRPVFVPRGARDMHQ